MKKGLIHVYTGEGKGKTTASVGLAVRALAHGFKVCYAFFNKKPSKYGITEINLLDKLGAIIFDTDAQHPSFDKTVTKAMHTEITKLNFEKLKLFVEENDFDLLIIDELLISVRDGFLEEDEILNFFKSKPKKLELVLTGRGATDKIMDKADYVSNIQMIKHPYQKGLKSRKGIEF
ncbi:MAG: cob(I)yrinic acid a,c-diamide adenosyltransferase [Flavobacteriia bacterium]|nr:MAG: cob(I)yrinic acid a,c-diamide adenosyltransferase [Flavobacteriia bacterium]